MLPELPPGIFAMFMNLWTVLRQTYVTVYDWFVGTAVNIAGESVNLIYVFIGSGLFIYLGYRILRFFI